MSRILIVSIFHPDLLPGGAQTVAYDLFLSLKQTGGHEVTFLASCIDDQYPKLKYAPHKIARYKNREDEHLFYCRGYDTFWHRAEQADALASFATFVRETDPDIVHFHHVGTLGANLPRIVKKVAPDARVIFTLHDFALMCHADGQMQTVTTRELCRRSSPSACNRCFPDFAPEAFSARNVWLKGNMAHVDLFTVPSAFMKPMYVDWGLPPDRILHVENALNLPEYQQASYPCYAEMQRPQVPNQKVVFGFFGQIVVNKGVDLLIHAAMDLFRRGGHNFELHINGHLDHAPPNVLQAIDECASMRGEMAEAAVRFKLRGCYSRKCLFDRIEPVDWVIVPSTWWEIYGLVVDEAFLYGKPVICANAGGPSERVEDGVTGLHFLRGNQRSLADVMQLCLETPDLAARFAENVRQPRSFEGVMPTYLTDVYRVHA